MIKRNIIKSVGQGGVNLPDDVQNIQELLNLIPEDVGGAVPPLMVDRVCGPKTIKAIHNFQLRQFGWSGADGRVDPDQKSIRWLQVHEGEFGATSFKIARCELLKPYPAPTDSFWAIFAFNQSAEFSLSQVPVVNGSAIPVTFKDETVFHPFITSRLQSPRSLQTMTATERIQPHPSDPGQSLVFLRLELPNINHKTDFVDAFFPHRWLNPNSRPASGVRMLVGKFRLLRTPSFGV